MEIYSFNSYNYYYYGSYDLFFLSDQMKPYYVSSLKEKVMYKEQNLFEKVKNKFGKKENVPDTEDNFLKLSDLKVL